MKMTEQQYIKHRKNFDGYCTVCDDITRYYEIEPDARHYPCMDCGHCTVMGIEEAFLEGHIELEEQ